MAAAGRAARSRTNTTSRDYKRYAGADACAVGAVVVAEELAQGGLLDADAVRKEARERHDKYEEGQGVAQQDLRADGPPEKARVRWVPRERIHAGRDEHMIVCFCVRECMRKVCGRMHHRERA